LIPLIPECEWLVALKEIPRWLPPSQPTVVITPHPDDETLGAGGLIATQRRRDIPVKIIAVTNGEAAYADAAGLGDIRRLEQDSAVAELGVDPFGVGAVGIVRLNLPDSNVSAFEEQLTDCLRPFVQPGTLVVAPWSGDPHPDHEACGRVAEKLTASPDVTLISYLFWAWHRNPVESLTILPLCRLELDDQIQGARTRALSRHRSQLEWKTDSPVLPDHLLEPARRAFETFILHA
jgi:LmbE family N-acetylglucosaminyl deacetylase